MAETIGFVGVGNMGGPMVTRLLAAGHSLVVYDVSAEAVAPLVARGARAPPPESQRRSPQRTSHSSIRR